MYSSGLTLHKTARINPVPSSKSNSSLTLFSSSSSNTSSSSDVWVFTFSLLSTIVAMTRALFTSPKIVNRILSSIEKLPSKRCLIQQRMAGNLLKLFVALMRNYYLPFFQFFFKLLKSRLNKVLTIKG